MRAIVAQTGSETSALIRVGAGAEHSISRLEASREAGAAVQV